MCYCFVCLFMDVFVLQKESSKTWQRQANGPRPQLETQKESQFAHV